MPRSIIFPTLWPKLRHQKSEFNFLWERRCSDRSAGSGRTRQGPRSHLLQNKAHRGDVDIWESRSLPQTCISSQTSSERSSISVTHSSSRTVEIRDDVSSHHQNRSAQQHRNINAKPIDERTKCKSVQDPRSDSKTVGRKFRETRTQKLQGSPTCMDASVVRKKRNMLVRVESVDNIDNSSLSVE